MDRTAEVLAKNGTWLSTQPFSSEEDVAPLAPSSLEKFLEVTAGTDNMYKLARKHGLKVAFGTDLIFSQALATRQGTMLGHMTLLAKPDRDLSLIMKDGRVYKDALKA